MGKSKDKADMKPNVRHRQSGSIFFVLMGAVAITAAVSAGVAGYIRGPLTSAVNTQRQQVATDQTAIAVNVATRAATSQPLFGDCDADGFVEPTPFMAAGTVAAPTGGGLIPQTMGLQRMDPWKREYGYCVWDHGPQVKIAGCGGAGGNRRAGTNSQNFDSVAIISSGKDGIYQTTCNDYVDTTPADGSPDTPLLNKPATSDDIVNSWNYGAAAATGGDLWTLEAMDTDTAEIDKSLAVKDAGGIEQLKYDLLNKSLTVGTGGLAKFPSLKADTLSAYTAALNWTMFGGGDEHTCSLKSDGTLWCWGFNNNSQLGDGTTSQRNNPTQIGTDTIWAKISRGGIGHSCGIKSNGTLWCWGLNNSGQVGDGTTTIRNAPVQIGVDTTWSQVDAGYYFTCGLKTNGTLWCWGRNTYGQIGDNTTTQRNAPVQVGVATNWTQFSTGDSNVCGVRSNNTMWCWGNNVSGQVGDGTTTQRNTPVQISGTTWTQTSVGRNNGCARKSDGTLWCWGYNTSGQVGDGTTTSRLNPTQVGVGTDWTVVSTGGYHACGMKTDSTLWCWGDNGYGQIGDTTTTNRPNPVQVGTGTNWAEVSTGSSYYTCARKTDGTLWCWGQNNKGQLGDGTTTNRLVPTQVPGAGGAGSTIEILDNLNAMGAFLVGGIEVIDASGMIVHGEQDPKIGAMTANKWCMAAAGILDCDNDPPSGAGDIQDGLIDTATTGAACTKLGELRQDPDGSLIVCEDDVTPQIPGGTCTGFNPGALSFNPDGVPYFCANM